jgi:hypothetical protein
MKKKLRSILPTKKGVCYKCGRQGITEEHHIFGGANRKLSEKYKLKVDLCMGCHRTGKEAVHICKETAEQLHIDGQRAFERCIGSREEFQSIFGKNYL